MTSLQSASVTLLAAADGTEQAELTKSGQAVIAWGLQGRATTPPTPSSAGRH